VKAVVRAREPGAVPGRGRAGNGSFYILKKTGPAHGDDEVVRRGEAQIRKQAVWRAAATARRRTSSTACARRHKKKKNDRDKRGDLAKVRSTPGRRRRRSRARSPAARDASAGTSTTSNGRAATLCGASNPSVTRRSKVSAYFVADVLVVGMVGSRRQDDRPTRQTEDHCRRTRARRCISERVVATS